jgi:hypothetical protein
VYIAGESINGQIGVDWVENNLATSDEMELFISSFSLVVLGFELRTSQLLGRRFTT